MTKEQLAEKLNGREYGDEISDAEEREAKAAGLVVVFGYSDDNAEIRGRFHGEVGCYDGGAGPLRPMWKRVEKPSGADCNLRSGCLSFRLT